MGVNKLGHYFSLEVACFSVLDDRHAYTEPLC